MDKNIPTTENAKHDAFFKKMMSDPFQREIFFLRHLPKRVLEKIDIKKLKMAPASFVDEAFSQYHSDLLFSTADKKNCIYFLVEHQSSNDHKIAWRLKSYKHRIWEQFERDYPKTKFPVIYSVVVYNGRQKYTASRTFWDLFVDPAESRKVENEEYVLIDLQKMGNDILEKKKLLFEYFFKNLGDTKHLAATTSTTLDMLNDMDSDQHIQQYLFFIGLMCYSLGKVSRNQAKNIIEKAKIIYKNKSEDFMKTIADSWIEEGKVVGRLEGKAEGKAEGRAKGKAEGRAKGIEFTARNMLKKHIDMHVISEVTGLSLEHIQRL
ncbi:Rpn family recombination-promoting nuclease/putative transposase [Rickettsia endosymbiont of Cardiosporidium cionae]|uniref:Rpn family recombination-promoting nuclease/putative transposase n=1 Tax=Rickettsia endosymbiont of Cardiosporidium cionae TaxID=2777155 RepID=UPI0018961A09|nr:Rpn family recombination-promoting nuclease/putative transposase [Rickettsia endosymbiont of Cardiosporidium cionae]KAF8818034.1 transposase [Rickettsia endosymbiont of Cardiosporidium cionae]